MFDAGELVLTVSCTFTCKSFDAGRAVAFVNESFRTTDSTSLDF